MKIRILTFILAAIAVCLRVQAQNVAVKTNILSDALYNPNVAVEFGVSPKWTVDLSGQFNLWNLSHARKWKHWAVQPEARYWLCDPFSGHFFGVHALGGQFNVGGLDIPFSFLGTDFRKIKDSRFQGSFVGTGIAYGYAWALHEHWNIEGEIGIGWAYTRYDRFRCAGCGKKIEENRSHNYFGPTKVAVNIEYLF